jgi:hypothetical protein
MAILTKWFIISHPLTSPLSRIARESPQFAVKTLIPAIPFCIPFTQRVTQAVDPSGVFRVLEAASIPGGCGT